MGVYIPIPISEVEVESEHPSRTYEIDWKRGRILSAGSCDGLEAVEQAIKKALLTPRFSCLAYDNQYGSELKQTIIANDVSREYIEAEMPRIIMETCLVDSRVLSVYNFSFDFSGEEAHIQFDADTIFGKTFIEEVI